MGMDVELAEIRDFLAAHEPFDMLPRAELDGLPPLLTIRYYRRGSVLLPRGETVPHLVVLRSGAAEVRDANGVLVDRGAAGATFGASSLRSGTASSVSVTAIEDSLVLLVPGEVLARLRSEHPDVDAFFDAQRANRMGAAVSSLQVSATGNPILKARVADLITREPVAVTSGATVRGAAVTMTEHRVSSLLVMDEGRLVGIVTDRDLRSRVLAVGLDPTSPVSEVMSADPVTGRSDILAFEVLLELVARGIHHLPIVDAGNRPVAVVTATDLLRLEQDNPVYLVGDVARQADAAGVSRVSSKLPQVALALVEQDASADDIGRVVTAVGDAVVRRLLVLAEAELGGPPVPYCWVALGSRARLEQALAADQDTALILDDSAGPEHADYFAALAERVTTALVECGYPRCVGDVMATNPELRGSVTQWHRTFATWLGKPVPDAVLGASIFFDMRAVHGDESLAARVREEMLRAAPGSRRFLAQLAKHAVANEPPLGFFRGFVLEREGEHRNALDMKRGGIGAVVDLARVLALSIGSPAVNTRTRIQDASEAGLLSAERAHDLRDAYELISYVRLRHQAAQVRLDKPVDNFVAPADLSTVERRHLREAFGIVRTAQGVLAHSYPLHYVS
ncbi:MAG: putative nucleotidyltransferase substrate binding domain-containing protein [Ornithinibacter sp.]